MSSKKTLTNEAKGKTMISTSTKSESLPATVDATSSKIDRSINYESTAIIWLDPRKELTNAFIGSLRSINDSVQVFYDVQPTIDAIRSMNEKIFFISSLNEVDLISRIHSFQNVEGIFVFDPDKNSMREFPKLIGIFQQQEQLLRDLRMVIERFDLIQLESFVFQDEKLFLWWQLWKEEMTSKKSTAAGRTKLVDFFRTYYRGNPRKIQLIDEFDKTYRSSDCIRSCFRSSFPSRPLRHALMLHKAESLQIYNSIIIDLLRLFQQSSKHAAHGQMYRGMKLTNELIDLFDSHVGQLLCVNGFFICSKSRNSELQSAASPGYRNDLTSVLFKIDIDAASRFAEVTIENGSQLVIFDLATSFRIVCVNRGAMSVIKLKTATDDGVKFAAEYKDQNRGKTITKLLEELSTPPKPPTPPPPVLPPPPPPAPPVKKEKKIYENTNQQSTMSSDEMKAREHLERGKIDEAIALFRKVRPMTVDVLRILGQLLLEEKKDYENAIDCYRQILKIEKETGSNTTDTLSRLGMAYHQCGKYDSALDFHNRALVLQEASSPRDQNSIALTLTAISNAHRGRNDLNHALDYAQRAWALCESDQCENEVVTARSLVLLTNVYHDLKHDAQALKLGLRALALYERIHLTDPSQSAELLNTLGLIQMNLGDYYESKHFFERALKIYNHIAPIGQSERIQVQKYLERIHEIQSSTEKLQYYS